MPPFASVGNLLLHTSIMRRLTPYRIATEPGGGGGGGGGARWLKGTWGHAIGCAQRYTVGQRLAASAGATSSRVCRDRRPFVHPLDSIHGADRALSGPEPHHERHPHTRTHTRAHTHTHAIDQPRLSMHTGLAFADASRWPTDTRREGAEQRGIKGHYASYVHTIGPSHLPPAQGSYPARLVVGPPVPGFRSMLTVVSWLWTRSTVSSLPGFLKVLWRSVSLRTAGCFVPLHGSGE